MRRHAVFAALGTCLVLPAVAQESAPAATRSDQAVRAIQSDIDRLDPAPTGLPRNNGSYTVEVLGEDRLGDLAPVEAESPWARLLVVRSQQGLQQLSAARHRVEAITRQARAANDAGGAACANELLQEVDELLGKAHLAFQGVHRNATAGKRRGAYNHFAYVELHRRQAVERAEAATGCLATRTSQEGQIKLEIEQARGDNSYFETPQTRPTASP